MDYKENIVKMLEKIRNDAVVHGVNKLCATAFFVQKNK